MSGTAFSIDLNADLGEGMGQDEALYPLVSSASIACGGHAGDTTSMRSALRACRAHEVVAGAHPGFADRENFGRRRLEMTAAAIAASVCDQIERLSVIAEQEAVAVRYFKLHGALANMASEDEALARTVFSEIKARFPDMAALVMENTAQEEAARALGLNAITEAYADRAYTSQGLLAPRTMAGAVIHDVAAVVARCVRLVEHGEIVALDGTRLSSRAQSICLHGETDDALDLARAIRAALVKMGKIVSPLGRIR